MTRPEAVAAAAAAGLAAPRIIPHKGKDGRVSWNLFHGPVDDRKCIVVPAKVDEKGLADAIASEGNVAP